MRPMPEQPQLIYLEPDDEITSVVRRLRAAEGSSVVIVAPGRSRATSSSVALRLLAQVAAEEKRSLALVADPATRAVAGEAGIAAYASVAEATSGKVALEGAGVTPRAPIHVVRGLPDSAAGGAVAGLAAAARPGRGDETVAVRLPPKPAAGSARGVRRRPALPKWPWLAGALLVAFVVAAALLPGATVTITPATQPVGPKAYQLQLPVAGRQSGELSATSHGSATGTRSDLVAATGTVTFFNWNTVAVEVPKGTQVSTGGTIAFTTTDRIVVPRGHFAPQQQPGQKSVGVVAVAGGPSGNVQAQAIDTIDDANVRSFLRGLPDNPNRLVTNADPTAGGLETPHPVIQQLDVDAAVATLKADLSSQLAAALASHPEWLFAAPPADETPQIVIPPDLVGKEDTATFDLTGTLAFDRPYVLKTDAEAAAGEKLLADASAPPVGTVVVPESIAIELGAASASGDLMTVAVSVRAAAAAAIDKVAVRDQIAGLTRQEAQAKFGGLGKVEIDLWPAWLDRLPRIPFRINVETRLPAPTASPSP